MPPSRRAAHQQLSQVPDSTNISQITITAILSLQPATHCGTIFEENRAVPGEQRKSIHKGNFSDDTKALSHSKQTSVSTESTRNRQQGTNIKRKATARVTAYVQFFVGNNKKVNFVRARQALTFFLRYERKSPKLLKHFRIETRSSSKTSPHESEDKLTNNTISE